MRRELQQQSMVARQAAQRGDWATVTRSANHILKLDKGNAEGHFLLGLARNAAGQTGQAEKAFRRALQADAARYDAAIELALLYANSLRADAAVELLTRYSQQLSNSPVYLDRAGTAWSRLGMHENAYPLYRKANELQPGVDILQANLAACCVYLGRLDDARALYEALLARAPDHQRYHYQLSRLGKATDARHVEQMLAVLERSSPQAQKNIFLYYALGKELEDLERWKEAFEFYRRAGDAARAAAEYDVQQDIDVIDTIIGTCTQDWVRSTAPPVRQDVAKPIFVVGLPRTGTTLTDRILSAHSAVTSVDETHFLEIALEQLGRGKVSGQITPATIRAAANIDGAALAKEYLRNVRYKLGESQFFVEKLPENFLYAGFIARAWPDSSIVYLRRNPLDTCFAMYKQSFFRYAYTLDDLCRYYVAHRRLLEHWQATLGDRLVIIDYEELVLNQERETRRLLSELNLPFESSCLDFEKNVAATATASAAQVREKMHSRSLNKWQRFAAELEPLRKCLDSAGLAVDVTAEHDAAAQGER